MFFKSLFLTTVFVSLCVTAHAQSTAFSYQGRLTDSTTPASPTYDFQFALYDDLSNGTLIGTPQIRNGVAVTNGIFRVDLDFGADPFTSGTGRFLQIWVRRPLEPTFELLTPRQRLTSSPYAVYAIQTTRAQSADALSSACVNCVTGSQIESVEGFRVTGNIAGSQISGTIPVASVPSGSLYYIQNTGTTQAGNFDITGNGHLGGTLRVEGTGITTGAAVGSFSSAGRFNIDAPFNAGGRLTVLNNGNVGIGNNSPSQKLDISGSGVVRQNLNSDSNAGMSLSLNGQSKWSLATVTPGQFQIFNQGLGSNALLIDNGTNNIGIGVTNPGYLLDAGQRIRIRSGGNNSVSAGLWLNNNANSEAAFIGMEDDTHVGFFGIGTGWKFGMNTTNGALRVNGSEGQAGEVITSNGSGSTAQWRSSTNLLYQRTLMVNDTGSITPGETRTLVPGLTQTVNVAGNAKLLIQFGVEAAREACAGCGNSQAYVELNVDGVPVKVVWGSVAPLLGQTIVGSWLASVGPGNHTIQIRASSSGALVTFGGMCCGARSNLIVQVIPE